MSRNTIRRLPDWRPLHASARSWLRANGHSLREHHVADIDRTYGFTHLTPRVRTYVVKLRYVAGTEYVVVVTPSVMRVDMTATRKTLFAESIWIATMGEVERFVGSSPSCVPPFADVCPLPVVLDSRVAVLPELFVPSGRPSHAVRISPTALGGAQGLLLVELDTRQMRVWPPVPTRATRSAHGANVQNAPETCVNNEMRTGRARVAARNAPEHCRVTAATH